MNKVQLFLSCVSQPRLQKMQKCFAQSECVEDCSPNLVPDLIVPYMQKVVQR
jgi:hypothetical protein